MEQIPSVGRMVHYMAYGSKDGTYPSIARAAVIAEIPDGDAPAGTVRLCVFNPSGIHFNTSRYSENKEPGTWSWPPRV